MASSAKRNRKGKRPAVPEDSPFFCLRIVNVDDIKAGKKELRAAAVKKYGDQMGDHIFLKVPNCGEPWKVKLRKSPSGNQMWLEEGWEAFTNFYLLEQGDTMVFNYEGKHSHFQVRIIGWDDMETDYPRHGDEVKAMVISSGSSADGQENEARVIVISSGSSADDHENEARAK
ncbi:putative transcription factor B3-Domain family [Rosa chinensis]|uniref:Putative transcription factor B3-Domain family n=1 Tax=Rosa chinensis TaxID=74649 RepID=A0A2P6SMG5_ROSCH|nr:B3 domain-containing transcription factor VRN1 [Rosa chinensis]PRQ59877.1 putative transcription factor B3-Domain family [Rosa chinensis]